MRSVVIPKERTHQRKHPQLTLAMSYPEAAILLSELETLGERTHLPTKTRELYHELIKFHDYKRVADQVEISLRSLQPATKQAEESFS